MRVSRCIGPVRKPVLSGYQEFRSRTDSLWHSSDNKTRTRVIFWWGLRDDDMTASENSLLFESLHIHSTPDKAHPITASPTFPNNNICDSIDGRMKKSSSFSKIVSAKREGSVNISALHLTQRLYQFFSPQTKPEILVLFCGGTLIMKENEDGSLVVNETETAINMLLRMEPRLEEIANIKVHFIDNIDSSNMSPEIWDRITDVIGKEYDYYDGFVITHGTDTMAYTASALSFTLQDLGKPVVLTGAQIPGARIESDARRNFVNAVRVATLSKCGVMIVFDGDVLLGARSHKMSESKLDAFGTINYRNLGEIRVDILFADFARERHSRPLQIKSGFEANIAVFTLFPGFPAKDIVNAIAYGAKGLILRGYGSGNISSCYLEAIKLAQEKEIPVVVVTQCLEGATLMHLYDVGKQALDHGVIQAYDMATECVITKLMWALKHSSSYQEISRIMHTDFCGELNKDPKLFR